MEERKDISYELSPNMPQYAFVVEFIEKNQEKSRVFNTLTGNAYLFEGFNIVRNNGTGNLWVHILNSDGGIGFLDNVDLTDFRKDAK